MGKCPIKCDPIEVRRTELHGTFPSIEWRCSQCGFRDTDRHGHFPNKIHRECDVQKPPPLTWLGRLLARMPPGDGIAHMTRFTGLDSLAKAWEQLSGLPCSCQDRQKWLNDRWRQFVWRHFAIPAENAGTAGKAPPKP